MDAKATGGLIARRRKEQNWSQGDLAERLHVTDKAVSRWETGRGLPSVDLLEPLAEALGLTVSELLSGRELTPEELPKAAGEQIMESMRRNRRRIWQGVLAALAAVALTAGMYMGYHYATSVTWSPYPTFDWTDLEQQAAEYLGQSRRLPEDAFDYDSLSIVKMDQRGDYLAALCVDGSGDNWCICVYDRDQVFPNRWRANGGAYGMEAGQINSWNFGDPAGNAVIVMAGWDLPRDIAAYSFENGGITYTCDTVFAGMFLDLFIIPDSNDIASVPLEFLDENGNPLPYENPWEPGLP